MADDELKIYTPQIIRETPLPTQDEEALPQGQGRTSGEVVTPQTVADKPIPRKVVAHETIGSALNTKARKILAKFGFEKKGAIQIGEFQEGQSGDIKISPGGIIARDSSGNPTFALDGETGDATFRGNIQARDFTVVDELGIVSLAAFQSGVGQYKSSSQISNNKTGLGFNSWSDVDASLAITFELSRPTNVFVYFQGIGGQSIDGGGPSVLQFCLTVDGVRTGAITSVDATQSSTGDVTHVNLLMQRIFQLAEGEHTIKVQWRNSNGFGGLYGVSDTALGASDVAAEIGYFSLGR